MKPAPASDGVRALRSGGSRRSYCGQPRNGGPGNRGFVVNQRWHIVDALPFRERIAFSMELFSHERTEQSSYARIGYHDGGSPAALG